MPESETSFFLSASTTAFGAHRKALAVDLNVDHLGKLFVVRESFLEEIRAGLQSGKSTAITGSHANAVLSRWGIGKICDALKFAHQNSRQYDALLFVSVSAASALTGSIAALCLTLDLQGKSFKDTEVRYEAAARWLEHNQNCILILDNVDAKDKKTKVAELLAKIGARGHVIVTSRLADWSGSVKSLSLGVLTEEDAVAFLLKRTDDRRRKTFNDAAMAKQIAVIMLRQLALALEQAGAMISQKRLTFKQYIDDWNSKRSVDVEWYDPDTMLYPECVRTTWQTTVAQLTEPARKLFLMLGFYSEEPIPESLLDSLLKDFGAEGADLLTELENFSLVTRAENSPTFTLHRLVQDVARNSVDQIQYRVCLQSALEVVDAAYVGGSQDVRSWPSLEPLTPHALTCSRHADSAGIAEPTARLLNKVAQFFQSRALYMEAEPLMRRALTIDEKSYGSDDPKVAIDINNLAQLLQDTNRLAEAESLMRRALAINEQSYGSDHPDVAICLNNLGQLLQATNRLAESEPLMRHALEIDQKHYGPDHPDVARDLNNLAQLLQATNRLSEAEPLMRRALTIDEQCYGPDHPKVAICLSSLAQLLQDTNRIAEAEPLMRRALTINEQSYGPDHPEIATAVNNLAQLLQDTNRFAEAEPLLRRALEIIEKSYKPDHPIVAIFLNNLAILLQATNRFAQAEPMMRRALEIDENCYGPEHPDIASDLNNLAHLLQVTNRFAQAEPMIRRALEIDEKCYGPDHPEVAIRLNTLAILLQATNRLAEAEPLMRRQLEIFIQFTRSTGHEHPHLEGAARNYYGLLVKMGQSGNQAQTTIIRMASETNGGH